MLLALALLSIAPACASPIATEPRSALRAEPPQARTFIAECAAAERPSALRGRLLQIRQRIADRHAAERELARQQRCLEDLRPFSDDVLGAHARRARLGQRTLSSPNDTRLGALARREIFSRPGMPQKPRRR
jgi:hypothetical protein